MKLIVGLGNPGKKYEGTRHNAGFIFVDKLVAQLCPDCVWAMNEKFETEIIQSDVKSEKIIFAKPQTFMNLSGNSVLKIMQFYKLDTDDLTVIADDKDLPVGQVRIRNEGSSAGQKGLQNIIDILGSDKFTRIRIGVRPETDGETTDPVSNLDTIDLVLSQFTDREKPVLNNVIDEAIKYFSEFLDKKVPMPAHTIETKSSSSSSSSSS